MFCDKGRIKANIAVDPVISRVIERVCGQT
jgi:hypothetical protein